jgi:hypothetical protein
MHTVCTPDCEQGGAAGSGEAADKSMSTARHSATVRRRSPLALAVTGGDSKCCRDESLDAGGFMAEWVGAVSSALAVAVGIFALWYANDQVQEARRQRDIQVKAQQDAAVAQKHAENSAFGQFLLQLDEAFRHHQSVHLQLRPYGEWAENPDQRPTDKELPEAEAYMGLFERVMIMIDLGLLKADVVERLYGYRVGNIWANNRIMKVKLVSQASGWQDFIRLIRTMEEVRGKKYEPGRWEEYEKLRREHAERMRRERAKRLRA